MTKTIRGIVANCAGFALCSVAVIALTPALGQANTNAAPAGATSNAPALVFDHSHAAWDALLKQTVVATEGGQSSAVDYGHFKKNRAALQSYLKTLSSVSEPQFEKFSRDQQLAFLINAYNAFIIDLVVESYPITSIKRLGIPFVGPWKKSFIPLLGKSMSPDDLEHGLIRKRYKESRIHFGVNCASISCPPLRAEAFVADRLYQQLDEQAAIFFANAKENRFDASSKTLTLNPILDWFDEDFTSTGAAGHVLYVAKYHKDLALALQKGLKPEEVTVKFGDYNWDLNDTATVKTK